MSRYKTGTRDEVMRLMVDLAIRWEQSLIDAMSPDDPERASCQNRIADFERLAATAKGNPSPPAQPRRTKYFRWDANTQGLVEVSCGKPDA